jgi:hypothetical protein
MPGQVRAADYASVAEGDKFTAQMCSLVGAMLQQQQAVAA